MNATLNAKLLVAFLALNALVGCVYHEHDPDLPPPPPQRGDVTFSWSFSGLDCAQTPEVRGVRISIPGEALGNDGFYPCRVNGYPGVTLYDFIPGAYSYTLEAYGYDDRVHFYGSGGFTVNGNVRVSIDLTPTGRPSSYAYVSWYFPANELSQTPSCEQARVRYVDVRIDDGAWERFDCALGFEQPGIQSGYLTPGLHTIELVAIDAQYLYPTHSFRGTLTTQAHAPVASDYQLQWSVGGASIGWRLTNGSTAQSCGQANVTHIAVHLMDEAGNWVYGATGDVHRCDSAPILYQYLAPGSYQVYLSGQGPNGTQYLSNDASPPVLTVQAGVFPSSGGALQVQLFRR